MNKWDWDAYGQVSKPRPGLHGGLHRHGSMPLHRAHMAVTVPHKERVREREEESKRGRTWDREREREWDREQVTTPHIDY